METWEDLHDQIEEVTSDKEMARSILKMVEVRERELESKDKKEFTSLVVEDYYEIIKEGITAVMAVDGRKTLSHEALVVYLNERLAEQKDVIEGDEHETVRR